ncbi:NAD(P)-dependent oxidoreductase [Saccharospirillum impatiens]|uniref:NAD(P)-dependent oxidoreductase n=1 Tax=Saccharospirillum impatiens TaxID=169438 RepID=UPI0004017EE3|nr:NAD(P)-binding oxidoreductase [Saccharospirillum impatiens]
MKFFIAGSTGATGRHVTNLLLQQGHQVVTVARNTAALNKEISLYPQLEVKVGSLLELADDELDNLISGCDGVISCLGHNLTFKGIYGAPRLLCREAVERISRSIIRTRRQHAGKRPPTMFLLMNTNGNRNRDLAEKLSAGDRLVIGIVRLLLPPHRDNELAAEFLRKDIGQNHPDIRWVVVRPDGLVNIDQVSDYQSFPSPVRGVVFNSGQVSRINVAHFITTMACDASEWQKWEGRMPVVYNAE